MTRTPTLFCVCGLLVLAGGCVKKDSTVAPPPAPQPMPQPASDMRTMMPELRAKLATFSELTQSLPGDGDASHRKAMEGVFATLAQTLPMLAGPTHTYSFDRRLRTLQTSGARLSAMSPDLSADATIDQGLRAVGQILGDLRTSLFSGEAEVGAKLDELDARVNELDSVHGGTHRTVVAQAVSQIDGVLRLMAGAMNTRLGGDEAALSESPAPAPAPAKGEEKPAEKPAAKPDEKPAVKLEEKPEAKPDEKPEVKPEPKAEEKPEPKPEEKPKEDNK